MSRKEPHPIYETDDFPRDGCILMIEVLRTSYHVRLLAPGANVIAPVTRKGGMIDVLDANNVEELKSILDHMLLGVGLGAMPGQSSASGSTMSL